jgi:Uma2 family endonuclease
MITLLPVPAETPRSMTVEPRLTDAEFEALCAANDSISFERTREGEILMNPPAGGFTSQGNANLLGQLYAWWKTHRQGTIYDSSAGFFLPDSSMLSPDAAYIRPETLKGLTRDDLTGFPRVSPDFVIELLSRSDNLPKAKVKMERWIENGVLVGWLIDPYQKKVYFYRSDRKATIVSGQSVRGSGPIEGFTLDLNELWRCYEL